MGKIQEQTNLEFQIPEDLLKQPIFVTFQSLSLKDGLRRILHGLSYACIFDSNGNVEKIFIVTNYSKAKESSFPRSTQDGDLPFKVVEEIMHPPEIEDIEAAMGIESSGKSEKDMNPSEIEDMEIAMDIKPPPEIEDMEIAMDIKPPPENEDIVAAMGIKPPPENEDIEAAMGIASSGKKENP